jgi:predicted XRE-type DNA-binding protein
MDNRLLVVSYQIRDNANFEKLIAQFREQGYAIHVINITDNRFEPFILPALLNDLQVNEATHLVILSNIMEVIFCWFRFYNSLADSFIYWIEVPYQFFYTKENPNYNFYQSVFNLMGIEQETVVGKIYCNINFNNYPFLFNFWIYQNNFKYFDALDNLTLGQPKTAKLKINKIYHFGDQQLSLQVNDETKVEHIRLESSAPLEFKLDRESVDLLVDHPYFIGFILKEIYQNFKVGGNSFVSFLFTHLQTAPLHVKQMIMQQITAYLEQKNLDFPEKIYFLTLLPAMIPDDDLLLKRIMDCLKDDVKYMDTHYPIFISSLFYIGNFKLKIYPGYYRDRRAEIARIAGSFNLPINFNKYNGVRNQRIAFRVDQLLSLLHSPTKVVLDFAKGIRKQFSEYQVKIFVEDNYAHRPQEIIIPINFSSPASKDTTELHLKYLGDCGVELYYADSLKPKRQRTVELIEAINNYNPDIIFTIDDLSLADWYLYPNYPMAYLSMGGSACYNTADVFLYLDRNEAMSNYSTNDIKVDPETVFEYKWGLNLPEPVKKFLRFDLGLKNEDFVCITVGNRLDQDINESYTDAVVSFLKERPAVKWLIVGPAQLSYLKSKYHSFISDQIITINYEEDLAGLYTICNAYLNPPRFGGGYSIASAMNQGVPIVILAQPSDGLVYVGKENSCGEDYESYLYEMNLLYTRKDYHSQKAQLMKDRIELFNLKRGIQELINYLPIAKQNFLRRSN